MITVSKSLRFRFPSQRTHGGPPRTAVCSLDEEDPEVPMNYRNLRGQTDIAESAGIIRRPELFIGIDSGPAHLVLQRHVRQL